MNDKENVQNAFNIPGYDFPLSAYDRPTLALSNLALRGDTSAALRSLFKPSTLSPKELETIRARVLGSNPDPISKTIVDLASNPLIWIGLAATLAYPVGSSKVLFELGHEGGKAARAITAMGSQVHDAFTNLRNLPGLFDKLFGVVQSSNAYKSRWGGQLSTAWNTLIKTTSTPISQRERALAGAILDGLANPEGDVAKFLGQPMLSNWESKVTPQVRQYVNDMRGMFNGMWKEIPDDVLARLKSEQQTKGIFIERMGKPTKQVNIGRYREEYFPHVVGYNRFGFEMIKDATRKGYLSTLEKAIDKGGLSGHIKIRGSDNLPDVESLQHLADLGVAPANIVQEVEGKLQMKAQQIVGGLKEFLGNMEAQGITRTPEEMAKHTTAWLESVDSAIYKRMKYHGMEDKVANFVAKTLVEVRNNPAALEKELGDLGKILSEPGRYSLDALEVSKKYIDSMAGTHAWHVTGLGPETMGLIKKYSDQMMESPWQHTYLTDQLIPLVRGMKDWKSFQYAADFLEQKHRVFKVLRDNTIVKTILPEGMRTRLMNRVSDVRGSLTAESMGADISKLFYLSSLGGNISSASTNLLQTYLTTLPTIGFTNTARGIGEIGKRLPTFLGSLSKGTKVAFKEAFPDFVGQFGDQVNIGDDLLAGDLVVGGGQLKKIGTGVLGAAKTTMMAPFSTTEATNRLVAFYGGKAGLLAEGGTELEAIKHGVNMVNMTQFPGGPLGMPRALLGIPSPLRQFMHFPIRYAGFLSGSTSMGPDASKFSMGVIGRTVLGSSAAYTIGKDMLGMDLSRGLMYGALPVPQNEQSPFYPFPFVPPLVGAVGTAVKSVLTGDFSKMGDVGAMMLPGGIAAKRAYQNLSKKYADYQNRTPDGKIPLYTDKGTLVGTYTPMQMTARAMGIRPSDVTAEQDLTQYLLTQRDQLREYRTNYLNALMENNVAKASGINAEFKSRYPQLGDIQVKKSDIKAIQNRREVSRMNRVLKGLPREYRPLFQQLVNEDTASTIGENLPRTQGMVDQYAQLPGMSNMANQPPQE